MPIKPRASRSSPKVTAVDPIESFISKGGSVVGQAEPPQTSVKQDQEEEIQSLRLRVPTALLARVDAMVQSRPLKTSRHHWLLEAMLSYLEREESGL